MIAFPAPIEASGTIRLRGSMELSTIARFVLPCRFAAATPHDKIRSLSMKFRPLHDRVVVKRIDAEAKTASGIIIPDTAQEKPQQGEVIAVGPGGRDDAGKLIPIDVKTGETILFGKWSGTEVKIDGLEYLIMKESDIMGVLVQAKAPAKAA
jgi:chaperonin GroES